ncbi:MAG: DUF72 domain-containing protein [Thermoanaerobaculia bacterium]|nr:DUF72 domain-containing protein [Thermoanaerobaculia bacterium]
MKVYTGTSGFSYKEWKGAFYPEEIKNDEMLAHYAGRLGAVEINNTFYRLPRREVLAAWSSQVPDTFRFAVKASRRITHFKKLAGAESERDYLLTNLGEMGEKVGAVLYQLPPYLRKDLERLTGFLGELPKTPPAAFEFRHPSWYDDEVFAALERHDAALVIADTGGEADPPFRATAGWGYLRLRREAYGREALAQWAERIAGAPWDRVFVFFKHEDEAAGPRMAERFAALLGG